MPICGFNSKMLEGVKDFHEGLIDHGIIDRAKLKDKATDEIIENEIRDMDTFLREIHNIKDPETREVIENLTRYARSFYLLVKKIGIKKSSKIISSLNKLYFEMDRKYYSELEGKKDAMKKLAVHLDGLKVGG